MNAGGVVSFREAGVFPTKVLAGFLLRLREITGPVIIDLGAAVGANVTFLGEELGCKLFVEDILADLGPIVEGDPDKSNPDLSLRLEHPDGSVDGVLCWDVLDYLSVKAARMLAGEVVRVLRPGGVAFLCRGTDSQSFSTQTTYEIMDEERLRYRECNRTRGKQRVLQNREIGELFKYLSISDSVLLANRMGEILFRKDSHASGRVADVGCSTEA